MRLYQFRFFDPRKGAHEIAKVEAEHHTAALAHFRQHLDGIGLRHRPVDPGSVYPARAAITVIGE